MTIFGKNKKSLIMSLGLLVFITLILGLFRVSSASAYTYLPCSGSNFPNEVFGRKCYSRHYYKSFFKNVGGSSYSVYPVINGGIPRWTQASSKEIKESLLAWLKKKNSGNSWDKTGSAFIVYTMLGKHDVGLSREISKSNWTELKNRFMNPEVTVKLLGETKVWNYAINTAYVTSISGGDIVPHSVQSIPGPAYVFYHKNKEVYRLRTACANPVGGLNLQGYLPKAPKAEYKLVPKIKINGDSISNSASSVEGISASISNNGPSKSKKFRYSAIRFIVRGKSNVDIPSGSGVKYSGDDWSCYIARYIGDKNKLDVDDRNCNGGGNLSKGTADPIVKNKTYWVVNNKSNKISDLDIGMNDSLCYTTVVSAYNEKTGTKTFRYAKPKCLSLTKRPKVQFWGSDVRTSKGIITSISKDGKFSYGSWAEYGMLATGKITSSSGAGLSSGPAGRKVSNEALYNRLTFANVATPYGQYGDVPQSTIPQAFLGSGKTIENDTVTPSELSSGVHVRSGDLKIKGGELGPGKQVIIRSSGTVTITGNLRYADSEYTNLAGLPQLVIVARNIIINANVKEVNAWLITRGAESSYVSTCGKVEDGKKWLEGVTAKKCKNQLQINGLIISKHLYLRRTFGGERDHFGAPAEVINLRPDAYLWAFGRSRYSGSIKTSYIRELPPRF